MIKSHHFLPQTFRGSCGHKILPMVVSQQIQTLNYKEEPVATEDSKQSSIR
jgi:hypothetical protein